MKAIAYLTQIVDNLKFGLRNFERNERNTSFEQDRKFLTEFRSYLVETIKKYEDLKKLESCLDEPGKLKLAELHIEINNLDRKCREKEGAVRIGLMAMEGTRRFAQFFEQANPRPPEPTVDRAFGRGLEAGFRAAEARRRRA